MTVEQETISRMNAISIKMYEALQEADTAFAVFNITELTPQARGCVLKTWPKVQDAIIMVKGKDSIYAEAVQMARAEGVRAALENMIRIFGSPAEMLKNKRDEFKMDAIQFAKSALERSKSEPS